MPRKNLQNQQNKNKGRNRKTIWLVKVILLVVLDQIIKRWKYKQGCYVLNQGMAFGLGKRVNWKGLNFGLLLLIIWQIGFCQQTSLIVAGGFSNWLDRIRLGGVIDYIDFGSFPSFNLADVMISGGVLLLIKKIKWNRK